MRGSGGTEPAGTQHIGGGRLASILGARFDADVHNERRLAEHRSAYCDDLTGPGLPTLRARCSTT